MLCNVLWCDVMWCDVMRCDMMWCDVINLLHHVGYRQKKRTDDNAAQPSGKEFSTRCMRSPSQKSSYHGECLANSCKLSSVEANGDRHNIMASASVGLKKMKLMYAVGSDRYGFTSSGTSNRCWSDTSTPASQDAKKRACSRSLAFGRLGPQSRHALM